MNSLLVYCSLFLCTCSVCCWLAMVAAFSDAVTLNFEMDSTVVTRGSSLEFSCKPSEPYNRSFIIIWKGNATGLRCSFYENVCSNYDINIDYTVNVTGVFGKIKRVSVADEGTWNCSISRQGGYIFSNNWNLTVYTIPGTFITQWPEQDVDLSERSVELECECICSYPEPKVQWIFKDQLDSAETVYSNVIPTVMENTCFALEKSYISTLTLPWSTTFSDNSDKTGTFSCRVEYPGISWNKSLISSYTVRFAVRVTEVFLQHNYENITEILTVNESQPVTLNCVTGSSRPDPTIDWYIGTQMRSSGALLTTYFTKQDNNQLIYCKAYNTSPKLPVSSIQAKLIVQDAVTEEQTTLHQTRLPPSDMTDTAAAARGAIRVFTAAMIVVIVVT